MQLLWHRVMVSIVTVAFTPALFAQRAHEPAAPRLVPPIERISRLAAATRELEVEVANALAARARLSVGIRRDAADVRAGLRLLALQWYSAAERLKDAGERAELAVRADTLRAAIPLLDEQIATLEAIEPNPPPAVRRQLIALSRLATLLNDMPAAEVSTAAATIPLGNQLAVLIATLAHADGIFQESDLPRAQLRSPDGPTSTQQAQEVLRHVDSRMLMQMVQGSRLTPELKSQFQQIIRSIELGMTDAELAPRLVEALEVLQANFVLAELAGRSAWLPDPARVVVFEELRVGLTLFAERRTQPIGLARLAKARDIASVVAAMESARLGESEKLAVGAVLDRSIRQLADPLQAQNAEAVIAQLGRFGELLTRASRDVFPLALPANGERPAAELSALFNQRAALAALELGRGDTAAATSTLDLLAQSLADAEQLGRVSEHIATFESLAPQMKNRLAGVVVDIARAFAFRDQAEQAAARDQLAKLVTAGRLLDRYAKSRITEPASPALAELTAGKFAAFAIQADRDAANLLEAVARNEVLDVSRPAVVRNIRLLEALQLAMTIRAAGARLEIANRAADVEFTRQARDLDLYFTDLVGQFFVEALAGPAASADAVGAFTPAVRRRLALADQAGRLDHIPPGLIGLSAQLYREIDKDGKPATVDRMSMQFCLMYNEAAHALAAGFPEHARTHLAELNPTADKPK